MSEDNIKKTVEDAITRAAPVRFTEEGIADIKSAILDTMQEHQGGSLWRVHYESNRTGETGFIDYPFTKAAAQYIANVNNDKCPRIDECHHWIEPTGGSQT